MLAWSLLLVCGLRLHRWSDRAVVGMAVAGMRPTGRRCSTASPRPCSRSSRWIPPTPTGPRSCAPSPETTGSWRWRTRTSAAAGDPAPGHPARAPPLGTLRPLEDVPILLTRAGFSGPDALHIYRALPGFLHGHILNSRNSSTTPTDRRPAPPRPAPAADRQDPPAARRRLRPRRLRRPRPNAASTSSWPGSQRH